MTAPALEIAALSKAYGGLRPLRIEQLAIADGERVALVGPDQPAAEMLTALVTGASLPDTGSIALFGQATDAIRDSDEWLHYIDRIGIVTERAALLESLTPIQNVAMPFTLEIEPPPAAIAEAAAALASEAAVPRSHWEEPVSRLGRDAQLRVRLARALALSPRLVVLEHPTAYLEGAAAEILAADLRAIGTARGLAMLIVTLDLGFAAAAASRVLEWTPATGKLSERRSGSWFSRFSRSPRSF